MVKRFSPASFTKNFGWRFDYARLHDSIASGFAHRAEPVHVPTWRANSGIADPNRQLVPLRFFLYCRTSSKHDEVLPDEFVLRTISEQHDHEYPRLALFSFHLAQSGRWKGSRWPDGRVAGWANDFIRNNVWSGGAWRYKELSDRAIKTYLNDSIVGVPETVHKMFTNYRHMLRISGVLESGRQVGSVSFSAGRWAGSACKLLWDRSMYSNELDEDASVDHLMNRFQQSEGFKLLGTSEDQGRAIAHNAALEYKRAGGIARFAQIKTTTLKTGGHSRHRR